MSDARRAEAPQRRRVTNDSTRERTETKREVKLTPQEKTLYSILEAPIHQVCSAYEPCPFEFLPSRFLSFLPHPLVPCTSFGAASLMELITHPEFLTDATATSRVADKGDIQPVKSEARPDQGYSLGVTDTSNESSQRNVSLTQAIMDTFSESSKLSDEDILKLCRKGPDVSITKTIDVYPDTKLRGNEYAIASSSIPTIQAGAFVIASMSGNQSILYSSMKSTNDEPSEGESVDGMPTDFVTIQMTTASAPKHWFCLRQADSSSKKGFVTEVSGKRVSIEHDTSATMSEISDFPVTLKVLHTSDVDLN